MKVIYTGKKPNPEWVGPWECSVCHTVVEIEDRTEIEFKGGAGEPMGWWITCPLCDQERRVISHVPKLEGDPSAIQDRINEDNEWARRQALVLDTFREERDLQ